MPIKGLIFILIVQQRRMLLAEEIGHSSPSACNDGRQTWTVWTMPWLQWRSADLNCLNHALTAVTVDRLELSELCPDCNEGRQTWTVWTMHWLQWRLTDLNCLNHDALTAMTVGKRELSEPYPDGNDGRQTWTVWKKKKNFVFKLKTFDITMSIHT